MFARRQPGTHGFGGALVAHLAPDLLGMLPYGQLRVSGLYGWAVVAHDDEEMRPNSKPFAHLADIASIPAQLRAALGDVGRYGELMEEQNSSRGSAVLVHGSWGHPEDWYLVSGPLRSAGIQVVTADLPSHRSTDAGLAEDAAEVRAAIQACEPPVVAAGWSYGGEVLSVAAAGEQTVSRLIYVADIPQPAGFSDDGSWLEGDHPHIIVGADRRFVLDNDWWLNEGDGPTFTPDIRRHLRAHPRRWVTRGTLGPQTDAAWLNIATTVVIGRHDPLLSDADNLRAAELFDDVRVLDTDHFVIFRHPEVVVEVIKEALAA